MKLNELLMDNKEQIEAVLNDTNTFVIGNPGTGKTTMLVAKIKHLLDTGIKPKEILCLTFTNKAKQELEERVFSTLKDYDLEGLTINTYHSFAYDFVSESFPYYKNKLVKESFQRYLLTKILKKHFDLNPETLKNVASVFAQKINAFRHELEDISDEELLKFIIERSEDIDENTIKNIFTKIRPIFAEYRQELSRYGIDYLALLENLYLGAIDGNFNYKWIIVDEVQDSNYLQSQIIMEIAKNGKYFVVGDLKQSIFRFQGANIEGIKALRKNAKEFILYRNFRSTQQILDYAKEYLINKTKGYEDELKNLKSYDNKQGPIPKIIKHLEDKEYAIYNYIKLFLKKDYTVGVLARKNSDLVKVAEVLDKLGIPYSTTTKTFSTSTYIFDSIIGFIKLFVKDDISVLMDVLASPFLNISLAEIEKIKEDIKNAVILDDLKDIKELEMLFEMYYEFRKNSNYKGLDILFQKYFLPASFALGKSQYLTTNNIYQSIIDFFEYEKDFSIDNLLNYIKISSDVYELIVGQDNAKVQLFTVHSAKGRQFDAVIYLPAKTRSSDKKIDFVFDSISIYLSPEVEEEIIYEEYKLDFVAFTRAKKELIIFNNKNKDYYIEGLSELIEYNEDLEEITFDRNLSVFKEYVPLIEFLETGKINKAKEFINNYKIKTDFDWMKKNLKEFRDKKKIYYSSLSDIKECPRKFLFNYILNIKTFSPYAKFGENIHNKFEKYYKGEKVDIAEEEKIIFENLKKCENDLKIKEKIDSFEIVDLEQRFEYNLKDLVGKDILFTGKIDAIFKSKDKYYIIDFKTNKSPSADAIQLVLYKYFYSKINNIPLDNIKVYFFYVNLKEKYSDETKHKIKSTNQKTEKVIEKTKDLITDIFSKDLKYFYNTNNKNPEENCFCPYKMICRNFQSKLEEQKN